MEKNYGGGGGGREEKQTKCNVSWNKILISSGKTVVLSPWLAPLQLTGINQLSTTTQILSLYFVKSIASQLTNVLKIKEANKPNLTEDAGKRCAVHVTCTDDWNYPICAHFKDWEHCNKSTGKYEIYFIHYGFLLSFSVPLFTGMGKIPILG